MLGVCLVGHVAMAVSVLFRVPAAPVLEFSLIGSVAALFEVVFYIRDSSVEELGLDRDQLVRQSVALGALYAMLMITSIIDWMLTVDVLVGLQ